jgi:hypothetical protein
MSNPLFSELSIGVFFVSTDVLYQKISPDTALRFCNDYWRQVSFRYEEGTSVIYVPIEVAFDMIKNAKIYDFKRYIIDPTTREE